MTLIDEIASLVRELEELRAKFLLMDLVLERERLKRLAKLIRFPYDGLHLFSADGVGDGARRVRGDVLKVSDPGEGPRDGGPRAAA